jgi:DNA-binding IclR family transcriptional regulator
MKTVKKALALLDSFTAETHTQGVSEIARKLGFHKSTTYSLLSSLRESGYVVFNPDSRKYSLGFKLLDLAGRIQYRRDLISLSLPILRALSEAIQEDVALSILIEGKRVCIALVESRCFVRQFVPIGKALHAHCSAAGKVLLAHCSAPEIDDILSRHGLPRFTKNTITQKKRLMAELEKIRKDGFGESREEYGADSAALAFPIFNRKREAQATLSIQSTVTRLNDHTRPQFLKAGMDAARRIGERQGE